MNSMITILIVMCYLSQFIAFIKPDICRSQYGNLECCPGYVWNIKENKCKQCYAGKIGSHCEIVCPYPWYGKQCLSPCQCSKNHCDPANGCIGWTTQDLLAGHSATSSRAEGLNVTDITLNANTSRHQKKPIGNNNEINGFLIYIILTPLVVAFILCLLYVRLVFRCHFEHS